jgi:4-diphosphocytidyl-2-C-methyl-D-erythritol kinase
MPTTFNMLAPAKINLFLHITGKRDDGYHLLQSVMVFVDVGDALEFSPHDSLFLDVEGPFAADMPPPHNNLIYKAAQLLAAEYNVPMRARITLKKRLPVASGIAGGSSDAATALRGLARLWGLPEEKDRLRRLGEKLGADVPACIARRAVWTEGIGERVTPLLDMPAMHFILVNPMVATPTPEVFRRYREKFSPLLQFSGRRKSMQEWIADLKLYRNDLTRAAMGVTPEIRAVLEALRATPNCHFARLSGSGATCFGVFDHAQASAAAMNKLKQEHPDWWISPANLIAK